MGLGSADPDGQDKAVLLANLNDSAVEAAVQFSGAPAVASQFARVDIYQITDTLDGQTATSWTGDVFSVPANSVEWIVFTAQTAPPFAAVLVAPRLDLVTTTSAPTLVWSKPENSTSYRVQVSADNAFSNVLANQTLSTARFTPTGLAPGTVYYWRVQASNGTGAAPWSETWYFSTPGTPSTPFLQANSAASLAGPLVSADSIATAKGSGLAGATAVAPTPDWPTTLGGATVTVRDSAGVNLPARIYYASPGQVNFVIPPQAAEGAGTVTVTGGGTPVSGPVTIAHVAPAVFAANGSGQGVAAAQWVRTSAGSQDYGNVFQCDASGSCVPVPIDLGAASDDVALVLYGTGIRNRSSLDGVACTVGGASVPVTYAGVQVSYPGFDAVVVTLPHSLAGRGTVDVRLTVDGVAANAVQISIL